MHDKLKVIRNNSPVKKSPKKQRNRFFSEMAERKPVLLLIFCACAFLIYGQCLQFSIGKLDEDYLITGNLNILLDFANLKLAFLRDAFLSKTGMPFYRPFQTVSFMIDAHMSNGNGWSFYFTNILLHAATSSALFYFLTLIGKNVRTALLLTLLFLCSPLFVHAIAWLPARGDLLAGLTSLLSLIFFAKLVTAGKFRFVLLTLISFFFAMFSKEIAVSVPVLCYFLYLYFKNEKTVKSRVLITYAGFILVGLFYFFMRFSVVTWTTSSAEFGLMPFFHNLRTLPEFLAKFIIPVKLSPMPGFGLFNTVTGIILIFGLTVFFLRFGKKPYNVELFAVAWFLLFAIPGVMYSHRIGSAAYDYLEHRSYLPMAGIIIMLFVIIEKIIDDRAKTGVMYALSLLVLLSGIYSYLYTENYRDPIRFYDLAISSNPSSAMAYNNRGAVKADNKDYRDAIMDYDNALKLKHDYPKAFVNKGVSLSALNEKRSAVAQYDSAIRYEPDMFQAHFNKANALYALGLYPEALGEYSRSVVLNPGYVSAYISRGSTYFQLQNYPASERDFTMAIRLSNKNELAYLNRASARFLNNNLKGACLDWEKAADLGNRNANELLNRYCK